MISGSENTISAHQLMLNPNEEFKIFWGEGKQQKWSVLTYLAIHLGVKGMQQGSFKTIDDLFLFMANFRAIIGTLLGHKYSIGWFRALRPSQSQVGKTYIRKEEQYANCFPEVEVQFSYLEGLSSTLVKTEVKNGIWNYLAVTLFGKSTFDKNDKLYKRTEIRKSGNEYTFLHVPLDQFDIALLDAREAFKELQNNSDLSSKAKRDLINKILFGYAETMPLVGGNAAATQMMYHVLEKFFLNHYTAFGMSKSKHGLTIGYPYDIATMMSENFAEFEHYLMNNILSERQVIEPPIAEISGELIAATQISKEELHKKIEHLHQNTAEWYQTLSLAYREVLIPRQYNPFVICSDFEGAAYSLNALKEIVNCISDEANIQLLARFYEELAAIVKTLHAKVESLYGFKSTIDSCHQKVKKQSSNEVVEVVPPIALPDQKTLPKSEPSLSQLLFGAVVNTFQSYLPRFNMDDAKSSIPQNPKRKREDNDRVGNDDKRLNLPEMR